MISWPQQKNKTTNITTADYNMAQGYACVLQCSKAHYFCPVLYCLLQLLQQTTPELLLVYTQHSAFMEELELGSEVVGDHGINHMLQVLYFFFAITQETHVAPNVLVPSMPVVDRLPCRHDGNTALAKAGYGTHGVIQP